MKELKCPKCGNVFTVDEDDYASIVNQVKNVEFELEVTRRLEELRNQFNAEQKASSAEADRNFKEEIFKKEKVIGEKDSEIARLREQMGASRTGRSSR